MNRLSRIVRLCDVIKEQDAARLEIVRDSIAKSRQLLTSKLPINTFAGRKTQEPFPPERADMPSEATKPPNPSR